MEALKYWKPSFKETKNDKQSFFIRDVANVSCLLLAVLLPTPVAVVGAGDDPISSMCSESDHSACLSITLSKRKRENLGKKREDYFVCSWDDIITVCWDTFSGCVVQVGVVRGSL